jgi:hypothetical protein
MSESSADSDATADKPEADQPEADQPEPEVFANRAARRAKGKKAGGAEISSQGKRAIGRSGVQSPRQYGTRRSG